MTTYKINLTPVEDLALSYVSLSQQAWIENSVQERCRIAVDEIVSITIQKCLDNDIQIPGSKNAMVELAFDQGWVKTAYARDKEADAEITNLTGPQE
jgi:hypothetical protein